MDKDTFMKEYRKNQFISQLLKCKEIFIYQKKHNKGITFEQCNKLYFKLKKKEKSLINRLFKNQESNKDDESCESCLTMQFVMMFYKKMFLSTEEIDNLIQQTKDDKCEFFKTMFQFKHQEDAEKCWSKVNNSEYNF